MTHEQAILWSDCPGKLVFATRWQFGRVASARYVCMWCDCAVIFERRQIDAPEGCIGPLFELAFRAREDCPG